MCRYLINFTEWATIFKHDCVGQPYSMDELDRLLDSSSIVLNSHVGWSYMQLPWTPIPRYSIKKLTIDFVWHWLSLREFRQDLLKEAGVEYGRYRGICGKTDQVHLAKLFRRTS